MVSFNALIFRNVVVTKVESPEKSSGDFRKSKYGQTFSTMIPFGQCVDRNYPLISPGNKFPLSHPKAENRLT